ncbi:hypothetical protein C5748_10255 [Phyllobacterium phragmitis]|uniref:Uncharacterized protein n=1 Tax=Phyllobacterium phragmitis TaxID=2670329 RepID=A0A2S9ISW2_9HYPH|nr:hypothetical protein [Phyllobacterium phragmitis]PRD43627.1 hypothetical protein C5748_10255 [Phyllobacterium phragmitis]
MNTQNGLSETIVAPDQYFSPGANQPSAEMSDLRTYSDEFMISGLSFDDDEVTINWDDGHVSRFTTFPLPAMSAESPMN